MWVSPNYQDTNFLWPLSLEDKIEIFLDRTLGWQLDIADQCINGKKSPDDEMLLQPIPHSGFAVLNIVLSYFEMIAKYQDGFTRNTKSEYYFKQGLFSVFPQLRKEPEQMVDSLLNLLYFGCRCGLYHSGMTDHSIVITSDASYPLILLQKERKLKINPALLVPALKGHLEQFGRLLKDTGNITLRKNFEKKFDYEALNNQSFVTEAGSKPLLNKNSSAADLVAKNQKVLFCGMESGNFLFKGYFSDPRNRFWSVLYRISLVPRVYAPGEFRKLRDHGIGLTMLQPENREKANQKWKYNIKELKTKIETFSPMVVAFNGKQAAQEFYGHLVHYGPQPDSIGKTTVFVLPSTSGIARKYWNESYWREMAEYVRKGG